MDSILLSSDAKTEMTEFMQNVYEFLRLQTEITPPTEGMTNVLANIERQIQPTKPELQKEIDDFSFTVPAMSWQQAMAILGSRQPKQYIHFIESGNVILFNKNPACYNTIDDIEAFVNEGVADARLRVPPPTDAEIQQIRQDRTREAENINRAQRDAIPDWEKLQRTALPELRQEDAQLVFLDAAKKKPNWFMVVKNLKQMGEQLGYTYQHYTQCLHRFIGYYNPALMPIVQQLTADELGQYLMALTVPEPPKERLAAEMSRLVRNQGENLRQAMAQLKALATGYYSEYRPEESQVLTNRVMILGLANFTVGKTRQAITQMLDQAQLHNRKIDWSIVLETAIKAEKLFGVPQTPMPFNPSGTAITTLFSSTFLPVDNPVQHDPSIIDISLDHNSQHRAYTDPAIISMPASNQQTRRNNPRPVAANVPRPIQMRTIT
jgi:hypothetical protein